ncbi:MAG: DUF2779 domain-containing protein [Pyrinomonadaceae bacterium]
MQFLSCPNEFWLSVHNPLLMVEPETLEYSHRRQEGYEVERYAKQLARFADDESRTVDFQRTFQTADLAARSDVVVTDKATGEIDIYEIKGSSKVKDEHYDDVAFQKVTAENSGSRVRRTFVVTLHNEYVREGEINVEALFDVTDVSETVDAKVAATEAAIAAAFAYLATEPIPSLADYCTDNKFDCRFIQLNFPDLPERDLFELWTLKHEKRRELLRAGIVDLRDIPDDFRLSDKQRRQVDLARTNAPVIDRDAIAEKMDAWEYPLHFLDYETFAYAIPQFEGVRPFQQMVFQYSLHTLREPGGELEHREFLSPGDDEPPRSVAESLRDAMSDGIGTVFVWYESFEKGRNSEMAEMFPDLADFFNEVNEKTYDLMKIFSENLYVHPDFKGRTSIKKVLPVLVPNLRYDELGIPDGMTATIQWYRAATWPSLSDAERLSIFNNLLEYCDLDTKAMVEIYNVLRSVAT